MNEAAYNTFWKFINQRHLIYLKKKAGAPKPWSDDPIFQQWKFCNVFRIYDKQTQLLLEHVIGPHYNDDPAILLFNIFAFRAFNWWPTYERMGGWRTFWDTFTEQGVLEHYVKIENQKLTSGAYMIRGKEGKPKYVSLPETLEDIWNRKEAIIEEIESTTRSLEFAYDAILDEHFWGWGEFTTYQIVLDLTYTLILYNAEDINTWCAFGPGAKRGIRLIYPDLPESEMLSAARGLLLDSPKFLEDHMPAMTLQDVEFSLCELQKYMRIQAGGKSKERYPGYA